MAKLYTDKYRAEFLRTTKAPYTCSFCEEEITLLKGQTGLALNVHHIDGDHNNNDPANWTPAHCSCHARHHLIERNISIEHRAKVRASRVGMKFSQEHKENMSCSLSGRKLSEDHKAKISSAMKGKKTRLGHKHSPETRAKMSASRRAAHERSLR